MRRRLKKFWSGSQGATAIEYCLMIALLSFVIVGAAGALSTQIWNILGLATNALSH
jgi:Flp pilus assembly pilin Flp